MTYVDQLRQGRNKYQVAFTEFATATHNKPGHLFCFFEGNDNPYYVPRIKRFTDEYYPVRCDGKQSVLAVHSLIASKEEYRKYKLGFFIDRDFNSSKGDTTPPIFETPCYAVENLYVSTSVFKEILTNVFHLSEVSDPNFEKLASLYELRQTEFHNSALLFNSWYACLIEKRESEGKETGVQLEESLPNGFIDIALDKVTQCYNFEKIKSAFNNALEVDYSEVERKMAHFRSQPMHKMFRGKYELDFLIKMIRAILKDSWGEKRVSSSKIKSSLADGSSLRQVDALEKFSAYAETPESLLKYLDCVVNT